MRERVFAFVAGSGMDAIADGLRVTQRTPFEEIDGVGVPGVAGHRGEVATCETMRGHCLVVLGRRHFYEGGVAPAHRLIDHLVSAGATDIVTTSAAGGLTTPVVPGELVLVCDVIDLQWRSPTGTGAGCTRRMPDADLTAEVERAAARAGVAMRRGTLACLSGPTYETPAEVQLLKQLGADLATMSSAPEIDYATSIGVRLASVGVVTNPGTGIGAASLAHDRILEVGRQAAARVAAVMMQLVDN